MEELITRCLWQRWQLLDSLEELAQAAGLPCQTAALHQTTQNAEKTLNFEGWLDSIVSQVGLEANVSNLFYSDMQTIIEGAAPALLECADSQSNGFLVLLRRSRNKMVLLLPDKSTYTIPAKNLLALLYDKLLEPERQELGLLLNQAGIPTKERPKILDALLREHLKTKWMGRLWRLRSSPGSNFGQQIRRMGAIPLFSGFLISYAITYGLMLIFWGLLGNAVFTETISRNTVLLLTVVILTLVPLRLLAPWLYNVLALRISERLKQRLLYGALRLETEEIRHQGIGQLMGRVFETEAIETSASRGSANIFMGLIQLLMTIPYLAFGAGGGYHVALLFVWFIVMAGVTWRYYRALKAWTQTRSNLTHDLIEQMIGYRTRLAQQPRAEWHIEEDRLLHEYNALASRMDRRYAELKTALPRGWMLFGLALLLPAILIKPAGSVEIAMGMAGILFSYISFQQLGEGLTQLAGAVVAWDQVKLMFEAAARPLRLPVDKTSATTISNASKKTLVAEKLGFQYNTGIEPVLKECDLAIQEGDQILLEGPSGSGKSTLTMILAGLRLPQQGKLILNGISQREFGIIEWRKRIVATPQFHENHIFSESFAFNLLMGYRWPPTTEDLQKAHKICCALGLGDLLERMPGGIFQFVGETGWQLSHGEKSRVYIARALLQGADVIILDESFSALDPDNLRQSLECVLENAPTVVVIAHP